MARAEPAGGACCHFCGPDCPVGAGYCHCGCGQLAHRVTRTTDTGPGAMTLRQGAFRKYLQGHQLTHAAALARAAAAAHDPSVCLHCARAGVVCPVGAGYCHCGCGARTRLARMTATSKGHVAGQPLKFASPGCAARTRRLFDADQIRAIRAEYLAGATVRSLRERWRCTHTTIERIVLLDGYQDVT